MLVTLTLSGHASDDLAQKIVDLGQKHAASFGSERVRKEAQLLELVMYGLVGSRIRLEFAGHDDPLQESLGLKVD